MIGMEFKAVKEGFFDTAKVAAALDAANRRVLSRFGAILRRSARQSMKPGRRIMTRKDVGTWDIITVSRPGEPPRVQSGELKRFLLFAWDDKEKRLFVGPTKLPSGKGGIAPSILEKGGFYAAHRNPYRRFRKIGDGGEVDTGRSSGRTTKAGAQGHGTAPPGRSVQDTVTYIKIKTAAQAARANMINAYLYGPTIISAHVAARPYMGPALTREKDNLPPLWAGSVHA